MSRISSVSARDSLRDSARPGASATDGALPHHCITTWVSHLTCPLPPHQSVIWLVLYHHITALPHYCVSQSFEVPTATTSVCQMTDWCSGSGQVQWLELEFAHLPTATVLLHHHITTSVSHLTCPLPPCYCISQSFDFHTATTSVSHLTCLLPLCYCVTTLLHQSVLWLAHCHHISLSFDLSSITVSLHYHITMSPC